jgi:hypothetical protein
VFSGTGSQTVFTLASDPGALGNSAQVYIGGVYQQRSTYTIAGTTLTFSAAPVAGTDNIEFINFLTSNIGATSADLVTYTPTGTGAVARSAASKFGDTVSVKDFGAVGDGVTDDTAAFQNAIAYAQTRSALGGGTIIVPSGRYALTSLIITSSIAIIGEEISSELIFNTTGAAISYQPTYATQSLRMTISGLAFSNVTNVPSSFIEIGGGTQDAVNTVIERCHFTSSSATWCIDNNRAYGTYIFMCVFADIAGGGVLLRQNAGLTDYSFVAKIEKCDFTRTTSNAIRTQGGGPTYIDGCVVQGITTGATGVLVGDGFAALGTTIQNSWFELNTGNDIEAVAGNTHTILVINTTFNGTPVIALGSTGKLLAIGVNSGGGGNICTVSGSGGAQAFLLGASNFVQSGTFDWTSLGYSGQNATTSSATLTFRNTADFNYVLTNQTSTVSRVGNVVDVFFTVTMTRNQIDASNFKLYITGFAPAITGTNYLAGQVSITGSDTFNGPLENFNNNGFVTLTDVFSAGASGRAWNLSGQLRYLTTP